MSRNFGGQRRTITCACGWEKQGSIRDANFAMKIHRKVCDTMKGIKIEEVAFDTNTLNSIGGVKGSKYGNTIKNTEKVLNIIAYEEIIE